MATLEISAESERHLSSEVTRVVDTLVKRLTPSRIVLFGSNAYGQPRQDSDIDLLIVMHEIPPRPVRLQLEQDVANGHSLQLVFMRNEEFEETKDVIGGIAYPAHQFGRVLYVANA